MKVRDCTFDIRHLRLDLRVTFMIILEELTAIFSHICWTFVFTQLLSRIGDERKESTSSSIHKKKGDCI